MELLNYDLLIIEDNKEIKDLMKILANKYGISVAFAANTQEFVTQINLYKFNFILCDLNLDYDYEGYVILKIFSKLRRKKGLATVIYSFTAENIPSSELLLRGFDGILKKDINHIKAFLDKNFHFNFQSLFSTQNKFATA